MRSGLRVLILLFVLLLVLALTTGERAWVRSWGRPLEVAVYPIAVEPVTAAGPEVEPEPATAQHDLGPEPAVDVELETEPQIHFEDDSIDAALDEAARAGTPPLEDLSEIALYDAADEVVDPDRH